MVARPGDDVGGARPGGGRRLGATLRRLLAGRAGPHSPAPDSAHLPEGPRSAYELVTRQALVDLTRVVDRLETKVTGLLFGVVLAVVVDLFK